MFYRSDYEGKLVFSAGPRAARLISAATRQASRFVWMMLVLIGASLSALPAATAITIDVSQLPKIAVTAAPGFQNFAPRFSMRSRRHRCGRLMPPPRNCFGPRRRLLECCDHGGAAASGGSNEFGGSDLVTVGSRAGAGGGGAGLGGGGIGAGSALAPSIPPGAITGFETVPSVNAVPGPVVGAGVPGLLLLGCALLGWLRHGRGHRNSHTHRAVAVPHEAVAAVGKLQARHREKRFALPSRQPAQGCRCVTRRAPRL